ncbi:MAG: hypothetical protein D6731_06850 [Planctomycetota bacterium]|nr:MAG: hypothetical protein D6731_06850 [Planctomycetota bacterium]
MTPTALRAPAWALAGLLAFGPAACEAGGAAPAPSLPAGARRTPGEARCARAASPLPLEADARLAALQRQAVQVAREELARGVRERPRGSNRGPRIDRYARSAGMPVGGAWCGHFVAYCYAEAARRRGLRFAGRRRLHSAGKVRSFFLYRSFTRPDDPGRLARAASLRLRHERQGSPRRYLALQGSYGDRWATRRSLPHEVFADPTLLPLRAGDIVVFWRPGASRGRGHLGLVASYRGTVLTTIEGNAGHAVRRRRYDLSRPATLRTVDGFARPALGDFE